MSIPDLRVTAIRSDGREAWTAVMLEIEWQDGDYQGEGQWPDAIVAATRAMESEAWRAGLFWLSYYTPRVRRGMQSRRLAPDRYQCTLRLATNSMTGVFLPK